MSLPVFTQERQEELARWFESEGIDPRTVALDPFPHRKRNGSVVYHEYLLDEWGNKQRDGDHIAPRKRKFKPRTPMPHEGNFIR